MKQIKVVIADDNEKMRKIIGGSICEDEEILVVGEAENGLEACGLVRAEKPDVLLLDMVMPKTNGMYVLEQLKNTPEFSPKPHVIVVSAVSNRETMETALEKGAAYYFIKPFEPGVLLDCVKAVVREQGAAGDRIVRQK